MALHPGSSQSRYQITLLKGIICVSLMSTLQILLRNCGWAGGTSRTLCLSAPEGCGHYGLNQRWNSSHVDTWPSSHILDNFVQVNMSSDEHIATHSILNHTIELTCCRRQDSRASNGSNAVKEDEIHWQYDSSTAVQVCLSKRV